MTKLQNVHRTWWKEAVVYQIYPRSFQDSNGDGIGDLQGIIQRLDYLESLGIDVVWLNPIYDSPNDDNGYDISDYMRIMSEFGTMDDFDELLEKMHAKGIKLVMDLVVNHSSDEHYWFQQSRQSRDNPYRDYYHWWPAEKGMPPPRWSYFDKHSNAWKFDSPTDAYYLHYFSEKQPDLNWENPKVRQEIYDMMHFWFKKGIDGFRMDVITFISKHPEYPEFDEQFHGPNMIDMYAQGPKLHDYLQEMHQQVLSHYDIMTVAEGPGTKSNNVLQLVDEDRQELNMNYHFDHQSIGVGEKYFLTEAFQNLPMFKAVMAEWDQALAHKGWNTVYLGNHDFPRMVSRWASDEPQWRRRASKMLTTFILTMRGTPYYYMGDEIGMSNIKFDDISQYKDLMTINWYHQVVAEGGDVQGFLDAHKITARDNARTPIQWDDSDNAGFTCTKPWLAVNPNYLEVNVANQQKDPDSELNYFKQLIAFRKTCLTLVYGDFTLYLPDHAQVFTYTRTLDDETLLVLLNFSNSEANTTLPEKIQFTPQQVRFNNTTELDVNGQQVSLAPYQGLIVKIR